MFYNIPKTPDQLPEVIPIFPLTGTILLPQCRLPLNIFEPRYLEMVFDTLCSEQRIIGIVQPTGEGPGDGTGPTYQIGCAGRITGFEETDDGRVEIQLTGLCRFQIKEELEKTKSYRRVKVDWFPFATDLIVIKDATISGEDVMDVLQPFFDAHHINAQWHSLERVAGSDLVDVLSLNLPFPPEDKQVLLEASDAASRFENLKKIATLYSTTSDSPTSGTKH
jgi:Lon protease-like protein